MASYTYTQLYGSGSIGTNLTSNIFGFTNPSGSSYFTMETIPTSTGFYEASSPKNFSGGVFNNSFYPPSNSTNPLSMAPWGLVTSSYIASVVVPPGVSSFLFTPAITITGTTYRLRGTGAYSLSIT